MYFDLHLFCLACNCNENGTLPGELCDQKNGSCPCKVGFDGKMCDFCQPKFYGFPNCTSIPVHVNVVFILIPS